MSTGGPRNKCYPYSKYSIIIMIELTQDSVEWYVESKATAIELLKTLLPVSKETLLLLGAGRFFY